MIKTDYEIFEEFFKNSFQIVRRATSFYGLSFDEIKQECAIVYFENDLIAKAFVSGATKVALRLFMSKFRQSIVDFSLTGMHTDRPDRYDRDKNAISRMETNHEEEYNLEELIMNTIELERLKKIYGSDNIEDVLEYYEMGYERYAVKHGISGSSARTSISRRISKIRKSEESL